MTISGYESAWLADLVAAFILENSDEHFKDTMFKGIYRDDGIGIFKGNWMEKDIVNWLGNFQSTINRLADSEFLKFTAEVWGKDKKDGSNSKLVTVNESDHFPYLDMEMFWENQDLRFKVHLKKNQMLKYLNKGSTHTKACFKAIPNGVLSRLAKLTSATEISKEKKLDELYPDHAEALRKADLAPIFSQH